MQTTILGIVGDYMYLSPFYGGDNDHHFLITKSQKADLLERGVEEYPSYDHILAKIEGKSYEDYINTLKSEYIDHFLNNKTN